MKNVKLKHKFMRNKAFTLGKDKFKVGGDGACFIPIQYKEQLLENDTWSVYSRGPITEVTADVPDEIMKATKGEPSKPKKVTTEMKGKTRLI